MNKHIFILAIFLGLVVFPIQPVLAGENLVVEFSCGNSTCPIFGVVNFAPGSTATGWAKVTNNSGATKKIAIEAINKTDTDNLASKMDLVIKEGETIRYEKTLAEFFSAGEIYLSDLSADSRTQYDLTVTFNSSTGSDFRGKTLGFDILIGFQGEEGMNGGGGGSGGGGGGGGGLPPGLTISNEAIVDTTETSATMTWSTSHYSTGYIIYGTASEKHTLDLSDTAGTPPKYGYEHATPEIDITPKATSHTTTITDLTPGTTYFYRAVSHGSLAVSREYTFTTPSTTKIDQTEQTEANVDVGVQQEATGSTLVENISGTTGASQQVAGNQISTETPPVEQQSPAGVNPFVASLGEAWGKVFGSSWIFTVLFIIVIVAILAFLFLPRNWFKRKAQ